MPAVGQLRWVVCPYRFCVKLGGRDLVLVNVPVRGPAQSLWANPQKKKKMLKLEYDQVQYSSDHLLYIFSTTVTNNTKSSFFEGFQIMIHPTKNNPNR